MKCIRQNILLLFAILFSFCSSFGQSVYSFESGVPSNYVVSGTGSSLSSSTLHVKSGKSLQWSVASGSVLTASSLGISASQTGSFSASSAQFYIYNPISSNDTLVFRFYDNLNVLRREGRMLLNYVGWRDYHRSYRFDYNNGDDAGSSGFALSKMQILYKPTSGSSSKTLYLDEFTMVGDANTRIPGPHMRLDIDQFNTEYADLTALQYYLNTAPPSVPSTTTTEQSDASTVKSNYPRVIPSISANNVNLIAAKNYVSNLGLFRNPDGTINGARGLLYLHNIDTLILMSNYVGYLTQAAVNNNDVTAQTLLNDFVEYLLDQGMAEGGRNYVKVNDYTRTQNLPIGFLQAVKSGLLTNTIKNDLQKMLKWSNGYNIIYNTSGNWPSSWVMTDFIYLKAPILFELTGYGSVNLQVRDYYNLSRFLSLFATIKDGAEDGIKPDGNVFHHNFSYNHYMYALAQYSTMSYNLKGTVFKITATAYQNMASALKTILLQQSPKGLIAPNSIEGRYISDTFTAIKNSHLQNFISVGGDIVGGSIDTGLAKFYNSYYQTNYYSVSNQSYDSFYHYNYAQLGVKRTKNWTASIKGFSNLLPGNEIYSGNSNNNRYGRYQSYGAIDLLYTGGLGANGLIEQGAGWDWNVVPGTTTVQLPWSSLQPLVSTATECQKKSFSGALSLGEKHGIFAMDFLENPYYYNTYKQNGQTTSLLYTANNLRFKKSVFVFDSLLICLGSSIGSSNSTSLTSTNLFQGINATSNPSIYVNSVTAQSGTGNYSTTLSTSSNSVWLLTGQSTGFYVPQGGGNVSVLRGSQSTPDESDMNQTVLNTAYYSKAYISHGTAPSNASYHYVMVPGATVSSMQTLRTNLDGGNVYRVLKQTDSVHAVFYQPDSITSYVFFKPNPSVNIGYVKSVSDSCLVGIKTRGDTLDITLNTPDLNTVSDASDTSRFWHATQRSVSLTLNGGWRVVNNPNNGQITTGCDSLKVSLSLMNGDSKTLSVVAVPPSTSSTPVSVCSSALPYLWNGKTYNAAGTYTKTLTNSVGCDSVATLVLTVKAASASTTYASICPGDTYTFNGTVYNTVGTYTKTLTNAAGCDSIATLVLSLSTTCGVTPPCNMSASIGVNSLIQCFTNNSYQFTGTVTGGTAPFTYLWDLNDGTHDSTKDVTHTYSTHGEHAVSLIVKDAYGCEAHASTVQIYIGAKPAGSFVMYPNSGTGSGITFNSTSTVGNGWMTYQWDLGNGTTSTLSNPGPIYYAPGTYTVTMIVTSNVANGTACSDTVTKTIVVGADGSLCTAPVANFKASTDSACLIGNLISFSNTSSNASSYSWNFGDGSALATTASASYSYAAVGNYTVTLTATNACGTSTKTLPVVVTSLPVMPAAISGSVGIVVGNSTTLSSATTGGVWSSSNNAVATVNPSTGVVTGVSAGTATITYTVTNGCGSASRTQTILVSAACVPTTSSTGIVVCANSLPYVWNGLLYYSAGTYSKTFVNGNAIGCDSTATLVLTVNNSPSTPASITGTSTLTVGGTTTLSSATSGGVWTSSNTGVATINPSTGLITAVGTGTTTISYTVSNACGSASASTLVTVNTACVTPVANFTVNNATQCLNTNSFVFTNTTTGTADSYTWNFGDGSSTATSPTHTYAAAGTYTVTLQASSACGGSSKTTTVTVQSGATAPAAIGGTPSVPVGSTTTLTSSTVGGAWVSSNTAVATVNPTTGVVTGVAAGTATISYTVNNGCGSASATLLVTVTVPCGAATTSTTNATICEGTGYSFNGGYYTVAGSYTAHLTNAAGCDSAATLVLTVNPLPTQPTAITGTTSILVAGTTTLGSTPAGGVWSSANTAVATVNPSTGLVTGVATGSVAITYTVKNGCGSRSVSTTVTVGTPVVVVPPTPTCNLVAGFTINNNRQCVTDNQFVYTSSVTGGVAPYSYAWNFHDGSVAATANPTKVYATYGEGNVQLQVTDGSGCVATAAPEYEVVGAKPTASFSVIDNTGTGTSKTFISASTIPAGSMSYAWNFGNGQTSTLINPTIGFVPGNYTVILVVTGNGGCTSTASQSITQTIASSISIYPNPVIGQVEVSFRSASVTPTSVQILDLSGRLIQTQTLTPAYTGQLVNTNFNIGGLQSGSYVIKIIDQQNGVLATKTMLKQ